MARELRPYQTEATEAVRAEWADGTPRTAVVLPTGTGKTDIIADLATRHARDGGTVLALAHRSELLDQIAERCGMHDADLRVGRVQGVRTERQHRITVASTATLAARVGKLAAAAGERERRRAERTLPQRPSLLLYDECHHAPSPSSMEVLRWAGVLDGLVPAAGFTATLVRGDKRGLGDVWQSVAFKRDIKWAIEEGFLVRPRGRVVVADHMDLNRAKVTAGDYQDNQLGEMVIQDVDQIVKAWIEHARRGGDGPDASEHRRTVVFAPTVDAAQALADEFAAQGITAGTVFGSTPHPERNRIYGELAAGTIKVLCSVMVTTEGWDCPPVECVVMARPTKLPGLYQQCIGRALRPSVATGKIDCLVLDVVGASRTQRLTTLIDLSPTAEYDQSEIDALPCEVCGYPTRQTFVGEQTCICPTEQGERDPDGGRRRLLGPAQYEDLDLLMQESGCVWLATYGGTPMLPAGDRTAILWHDKGADLYRAGHMANRGTLDGQWLTETSEGMTTAMQRAEAWATAYAPMTAKRSASWRRSGAASERQIDMARRLGIPGAEQMTRARLSDEISVAITSRRLGR